MYEASLFSTPSPAFIVCRCFDDGHSDQSEVISVLLICISLIISDVQCLFMFLSATCMLSLEKCVFRSSTYFLIGDISFCFFFNVELHELLNILKINPLLVTHLQIFSSFLWALFILGKHCLPGVSFYSVYENTSSR